VPELPFELSRKRLLVTPGHQALLLSAASSCRSWTGLWLFPGGILIIPAIV
jgi:hypothetical protein